MPDRRRWPGQSNKMIDALTPKMPTRVRTGLDPAPRRAPPGERKGRRCGPGPAWCRRSLYETCHPRPSPGIRGYANRTNSRLESLATYPLQAVWHEAQALQHRPRRALERVRRQLPAPDPAHARPRAHGPPSLPDIPEHRSLGGDLRGDLPQPLHDGARADRAGQRPRLRRDAPEGSRLPRRAHGGGHRVPGPSTLRGRLRLPEPRDAPARREGPGEPFPVGVPERLACATASPTKSGL